MIIRIFRVQIHPELKAEFEIKFHDISIPVVETQQGIISVSVGKPTQWTPNEYVMVSTWEDENAIVNFAGKNWNQAVIPDGMQQFVLACWVHHYEIF